MINGFESLLLIEQKWLPTNVLYTHLLTVFGTSLKANIPVHETCLSFTTERTHKLTLYMQINIIYMTLQLTNILITFIYVSIIKYQYCLTYTSTKLRWLYML